MTALPSPDRTRARSATLGRWLLAIWAVLFVCGALGDLLDIEFLRSFTDVKRLFLR